MASGGIGFRPVGASGLLVEVADVHQAQDVYTLVRRLAETSGLEPPVEVVPAAQTVLLDGLADVDAWQRLLADSPLDAATGVASDHREHLIAVRYDGEDLADVAAAWDLTEAEVVERHTATVFTVSFCGFAPGFAYCTHESDLPPVRRRPSPRERVPAGSVALAGEYCGIYPSQMPGGWQLIGRTDAVLFDPSRTQPALLRPGDSVRFEAER